MEVLQLSEWSVAFTMQDFGKIQYFGIHEGYMILLNNSHL